MNNSTRFVPRFLIWLAALAAASWPAAGELTIEGKIDAGGAKVTQAAVSLVAIAGPFAEGELLLDGAAHPQPVVEAAVDPRGIFDVAAPEIGMWAVLVDVPGFAVAEYRIQPLLDAFELPTLELERAETLTVEVRGRQNRPVADARVLVYRVRAEIRRFLGRRSVDRDADKWNLPVLAGRTGEDGRLEMAVEADGVYFVRVVAPGYLPAERELRQVSTARFELRTGRERTLRAIDDQGRPVAGALVFEVDTMLPLAATGDDGRAVVLQGDETLRLRLFDRRGRHGETALAPAAGDEEPEAASVTVAEPERIAGRVIDRESRRPIGGALTWPAGSSGDFTRTDGAGAYELHGAGEGNAVWAAASGYAAGFERLPERRPGAKAFAETGGPTLALTPAGAVSGQVVDPEGNPVAEVEVVAQEKRDMSPNRMFRMMRGLNRPQTARSSRRGAFRVAPLPAGVTYELTFRHDGYSEATVTVENLAPFEERADLSVVLDHGRRAHGRVTDSDDAPVAGATVRLTPRKEGPEGMMARMIVRIGGQGEEGEPEHSTDREGIFEIADLAAGKYDLEVEASGFARAAVPGVEVAAEATETDLGTVVLAPGAKIEGRVVDPEGNALAAAEIRVGEDSGMPVPFLAFSLARDRPRARTGGSGEFTVGDLREGEKVHVLVTRADFVDATVAGVVVPTVEPLEVTMKRASRVTGRVVDGGGRPLEEAQVQVRAEGQRMPGSRTKSRADGTFEVTGVAPGRVTLSAQASGYQEYSLSGLEIPDGGDLTGVTLTLAPGAVVEGTVFAPDGRPVIDARVRSVEPGSSTMFSIAGLSTTDGDGRYWLDGLPVGRRTVIAEHDVYQRVARDVEVAQGVNKLDLVFEGGVDVAGRVIGPQGEPVAEARVQLSGAGSFFFLGALPETVTGIDGTFVLAGVQPGQYHVHAAKEGLAAAQAPEPITVGQSPVAGIEIRLSAGATLSGEVVGLTVDELAELSIYARKDRDFRAGEVDFESRYQVRNLGVGEWQVVAELSGGGRRTSGRVGVAEGDAEVHLDLEFGSGYVLTGTVSLGDNPMAGAWVFASGKTVNTSARTTTAQDGTFRLEGLEEGVYDVYVTSVTGPGLQHHEEIEIQGDDDVVIELVTARLTGWVRDSYDQTPLAGVAMRLQPVESEEQGGILIIGGRGNETDSRGYFSLSDVPEGTWKLVAKLSGYAPAERVIDVVGRTVEEIQLELTPTEGLFFEVALPLGGAPPRVNAAVLRGAGGGQDDVVVGGVMETGEDGRVRMTEVPPGSFELLIAAAGTATVAMPVTSPGQLGRVVLALGGSLEITVPELEAQPSPAKLVLVGPSGRPFRQVSFGGRVITEASLRAGRASLTGLEPGAWTFTVRADDGRSWRGQTQVSPNLTARVVME